MSKTKKVTTVIQEGEGIDAQTLAEGSIPAEAAVLVESAVNPEDDSLSALIGSMGVSPASVRVYRHEMRGGTAYVTSIDPALLSEEYIQANLGPGRYTVRAYNEKGIYITSKTFTIANIFESPLGVKMPAVPTAPSPASGDGSLVQAQIDMLRSELVASREILLKVIESSQHNNSGSSLTELANAIALVQGMVPKASSGFSQVADMVEIFKKGVELGTSGGGGDRGWVDTIKDVLSSLPDMIQSFKGPLAVPPVVGGPALIEGAVVDTNKDTSTMVLKQGIAYLKSKARAGKDPGLWIDVIVDNLEDGQWQVFLGLLNKPYEEIAKLDPDLLLPVYRAWFEQLFAGLKDALNVRLPSAGGAAGNGADVAENAGTGATDTPENPTA